MKDIISDSDVKSIGCRCLHCNNIGNPGTAQGNMKRLNLINEREAEVNE